MADFTIEQQQAIAKANARMRLQQEGSKDEPSGLMPFLNKGIAQVLGAPVDLVSAGLGAVGVETGDAVGGSESIRKGMAAIGAPTPDRDPETTAEFIGSTLGEAAGFALPAGGAAKLASKGSGVVAGLATGALESAAARPAATLAVETLGATGAGIGRQVAEEQELGEGGALAAEIVGGMGLGALPSLARAAPTALAAKGFKAASFPFTERGALERASARVQELAADPMKAAAAIDDLKGSKLLPSARTDEPGLMALEKSVLDRDPAEVARISTRTSDAVKELQDSVVASGKPSNAKDFIRKKRDRLQKAITARIESAADEAADALDLAGPNITAEDATILTRDALERSLADAKIQESQLWNAVDKSVKVPTTSMQRVYKDELSSLAAAQSNDMPNVARKVIGGEADVAEEPLLLFTGRGEETIEVPSKVGVAREESMQEIDGLYKKLGEISTQARAAKEFNKARIAEKIRDAIIDDMKMAKGPSEAVANLQTARAFSRQMNEKFRKGPVGKILGYGREGGPQMAPELALETQIGVGGQRGELGRRAIAQATGDAGAAEGIQQYLKNRFIADATVDGVVVPARAQTFMKKFGQMLENFTDLSAQLSTAVNAEDVARRVTKRGDGFRRAMDREAVSKTARFLNSPVNKEVDRIFQSPNPKKFMTEIAKTLRKDKTGEAMDGLRAGVSDYLIKQIETQTTDIQGRTMLNGLKLERMLRNTDITDVLGVVFNKREMRNWDEFAKQIARFQKQSAQKGQSVAIIKDRPAWLLEKAAQVLGAKVGAKLSGTAGGSIQSAAIGSSTMRQILNNLTADKARQLIIDSIEDPELMKVLLTHRPGMSTRTKNRLENKLRLWMLGSGSRILNDEEQESLK